MVPLEHVLTQLEQQTHRRFIKTHLPLDGLRFDQRVKYLCVGRDTRDVFMSWWNHYRSFTEEALISFNTAPGRVGPELPRCPDDIHNYWRTFMTRGWFDWENEGYPSSSPLRHAQSWWDYRHLPNILLVRYADLLADFRTEVQRIADFLEIQVPQEEWPTITRNCTLSEMRASANEVYLKLIRAGGIRCENRVHFRALCSQIMRRILVDHARDRGSAKRGGTEVRVSLDGALLVAPARGIGLLALDEALEKLSRIDARKGRVVELRYFGGLSVEETAEFLRISPETVKRDWRIAKAWLLGALTEDQDHTSS
jgi:RNA polymerase sigma factor (TIGR02999 family)